MLLSWQAKVLNRIYHTSYFSSLTGLFSSLETFDYAEVLRSYCRFTRSDPDQSVQALLSSANKLVQKKVTSYEMFPEVVALSDLYRRQPEHDFGITDVILASSLSKCKIWPKLYRSNAQHEKLGVIVQFYRRFVEHFREDLDFKFDPAILSAKYTKAMERNKLRKKTNLPFLRLVGESQLEKIAEEVKQNPQLLWCIEPAMEKQPLHVAAEKATLATIKLLIELGADTEVTDKELQTPLFYAVKRGDFDVIRFFVEEVRVNIHHEQHQKRNVVYLAAFEGNLPVVKYLHGMGCDINKQSSLGRTALSKACYLGQVSVVEYLLSVKADFTLKDHKERSPMHNAAWGRQGGRDGKKRGDQLVDDSPECVQLLLDAGHLIDVIDSDGFTPFFSSVSSNGARSFELLIKRGANLNHLTKKGENACLLAAKYGHLELLKQLVEEHHADINLRDSYGISALEAAAILDYDKPAEQREFVLQQAFDEHDQLDQPVRCFSYLMDRVFAPSNDAHRTFTFGNFINATLFYKRQDYLRYLLRNTAIQKTLRHAVAQEKFEELIELSTNLSDGVLKEFVGWLLSQLSAENWQFLLNTLLQKGKLEVVKHCLDSNPPKVKLSGLKNAIKFVVDEDLLWKLLRFDSDCTDTLEHLSELLTTLITGRRTQTLIRMLVAPEPAEEQKSGVLAWNKTDIASVVTQRSEESLSLVQYCELNNYKDIARLLESLAQECLKVERQELLGFRIPEYQAEVQHRWKRQVVIPSTKQTPLLELLNEKERSYMTMFAEVKDKAAFVQQEKKRKPLVVVDTLPQLEYLLAELPQYNLWGIDIEYYSQEHSFVCTLQLSNLDRSYVVDALRLREHVPRLAILFEQPSKLKLFHGCENDIRWLCEDFSLKTVGIYDTCKVNHLLTGDKASVSLKKLAETSLGYQIDKDYQTADWRIRPLLHEMLDYARMDSEVLLYVFMEQLRQAYQQKKTQEVEAQCYRERKLTLRSKHCELRLK